MCDSSAILEKFRRWVEVSSSCRICSLDVTSFHTSVVAAVITPVTAHNDFIIRKMATSVRDD